jgi:hypothetical protein
MEVILTSIWRCSVAYVNNHGGAFGKDLTSSLFAHARLGGLTAVWEVVMTHQHIVFGKFMHQRPRRAWVDICGGSKYTRKQLFKQSFKCHQILCSILSRIFSSIPLMLAKDDVTPHLHSKVITYENALNRPFCGLFSSSC